MTNTIDSKQLHELLAAATALPWKLWTSNSHRRITGEDGRGRDGGVLSGSVHKDGTPDLVGENSANDLKLIIAAVNALPALLKERGDPRRTIYDQIEHHRNLRGAHGLVAAGTSEEDGRPRPAWATLLRDAASGLARVASNVDGDQWRHCLVGIAALCVAAIEAHDRGYERPIESEHTTPTEAPSFDPRCGSQGIDSDGHCLRCGLRVDPRLDPEDVTERCPPGFLVPDGGV